MQGVRNCCILIYIYSNRKGEADGWWPVMVVHHEQETRNWPGRLVKTFSSAICLGTWGHDHVIRIAEPFDGAWSGSSK